jgi:hypothetical protein
LLPATRNPRRPLLRSKGMQQDFIMTDFQTPERIN